MDPSSSRANKLIRNKTDSTSVARAASNWGRKSDPKNQPVQLMKSRSANAVQSVEGANLESYDIVWETLVSEAADTIRAGAAEGGIFLRHIDPPQKGALSSMLRFNGSALTKLYLEECSLFTHGSNEAIVRSLEGLVHLEELSLRNCEVYDKLTAQIMVAVRHLEHLRRLSLVHVGCTKAISEDLRQLCQGSLSLESIQIREGQVSEQYFSWTINSAASEMRTSVSYYMAQNRQFRQVREGKVSPSTSGGPTRDVPIALGLMYRRLETVPQRLLSSEPCRNSLTNLDLSSNSLTSVTESIGHLENLEHLDLSCNQLSVLPTSLLRLVRLRYLNVSHNELVELSEAFGFLQRLVHLNVSCNRLRTLPAALACLPKLCEVNFQDPCNPTNRFNFPAEVRDGGSLSILTHLKYNLKRKQPYAIAPVFFIGQRQSGKTRLRHMLAHGSEIRQVPQSARRKASGSDRSSSFLGLRKSSVNQSLSASDTHSGVSSDSTDNDETCFVETQVYRYRPSRSEIFDGRLSTSRDSGSREDTVVEVWDFSGHDLIPLFQREGTCFVCCVNVSSERFSASVVLRLLNRVEHHAKTRILVVGTFTDQLHSSRVSVVEEALERVQAALPNVVVGHMLLSLRGDHKAARKQVREAIAKMTANVSLRQDPVPSAWLVLFKMLKVLGDDRAVPVMEWDELVALATSCSIPEEEILPAFQFLVSTSHFNFSEQPGQDWCIASPAWVAAMWAPLRLLQTKAEHQGLVSADELVLAWQATCPTWATRPWVSLLKRLRMVLPLPKQRLLLVPHLLAKERPATLESYWPMHCSPEQMQYSRYYTLSDPILNEFFFSQLALRLLRGGWRPNCVWRAGLCLVADEEVLLVEASSSSTVLKLHVRAVGVSAHFISLIFAMSNLLQEQALGAAVVQVPCIHCLKDRSYDPFLFSRAELEDAVAAGKGVVLCRSVNPILIHSMAPDISMAGIGAHTVDHNELTSEELIGEGGFAKVYLAMWRNEPVAVKKLLPIRGSKTHDGANDEERRTLFSDFRREAWLMSGLEHPNLVILRGVCLEPFCIIMDYMNAGTLHAVLHYKSIAGKMPDAMQVKLALDVAKGMEFLHGITPPIVHRDLKSPNILLHVASGAGVMKLDEMGIVTRSLSSFDVDLQAVVAKVSDFGLSTEAELSLEFSGSVVDNPTWTAPEMLAKSKYTGKVDVYSFGVILWEMLTRQYFFGEIKFMAQLEEMVRAGQRPPIPADAPLPLRILIETCWAQDPSRRPTFTDVRKVLQKMATESGVITLKDGKKKVGDLMRRSSLHRMVSGGVVPPVVSVSAAPEFSAQYGAPQVLTPSHSSSIATMAVVDPHLWTASSQGEIFVWDLQTQVLIHQHQPPPPKDLGPEGQTFRHPSVTAIHSLVHTVWTGHSDGTLCVWSRDLKVLKHPKKHTDSVTFIGSEGSSTVITAGMGGTVRRWNIHNFRFQAIEVNVPIVCMAQLGVNLVFGSGSNLYMLFPDKATYQAPRVHTAAIHACVVVRDMVWTASSDKTIRAWRLGLDARSLEPVAVLHGHSSRVFCLALDPLADWVFSGSWDTAVMLWDVKQFKFDSRIKSDHKDAVSQLAFCSVGGQDYLVSASMDKTVCLYRRKSDAVGAEVEDRVMEREIANYQARRRVLERCNSVDQERGRDALLSTSPKAEDVRYLELLTPTERQYLMSMTTSHRSGRRGSALLDGVVPSRSPKKMIRSPSVDVSSGGSGSGGRVSQESDGSSMGNSPPAGSQISRSPGRPGRASPRKNSVTSPEAGRPRSRTLSDVFSLRSSAPGTAAAVNIPESADNEEGRSPARSESTPAPFSAVSAERRPLSKLKGLFRRSTTTDMNGLLASPNKTPEKHAIPPGSSPPRTAPPRVRVTLFPSQSPDDASQGSFPSGRDDGEEEEPIVAARNESSSEDESSEQILFGANWDD